MSALPYLAHAALRQSRRDRPGSAGRPRRAVLRPRRGQPAGEVHGAPAQAWRDPEGNEFCLITEG
jgi:hypothetical protein